MICDKCKEAADAKQSGASKKVVKSLHNKCEASITCPCMHRVDAVYSVKVEPRPSEEKRK